MFHVIRDADSPEFFSVALNLLRERDLPQRPPRGVNRPRIALLFRMEGSTFLHPDVDAVATGESLISVFRAKSPTIPSKV